MHAVVSLLDPVSDTLVRMLWAKLDANCGLRAALITPLPHVSWLVGEGFDFETLRTAAALFAAEHAPMTTRMSGLGVFTGAEDIVFFVQLVKTQELMRFHRAVSAFSRPHVASPSPHYAPDRWMPHITLAHRDVTPDSLACAARALANQDLTQEVRLESLSIVVQEQGGTAAELSRHVLAGYNDPPAP